MFLITTKRHDIEDIHEFSCVDKFEANSLCITVLTDGFLSKYTAFPKGFSVIESPLVGHSTCNDVIFSQAAYDDNEGILNISRSTISGRPIYYHINSQGDFFCSTHISMLRQAGVFIEENTEVLPEFFVYRFVMPPQTLYKGIRELVVGTKLSIRLRGGRCRIGRVDKYNPPLPNGDSDATNSPRELSALLGKSLRALSPCQDRIAVLLSGGIDSSILFRICQDNYAIDTTYSTGYPFEAEDKQKEKEYALTAANAFGTIHKYYEVTTKEYLRGILEGISAAEIPLKNPQLVMFHLLYAGGLSEGRNIVISGEGADGVFGLPFHNSLFRAEKWTKVKLLSKCVSSKWLEYISRVIGKGKKYARFYSHVNRRAIPISDPDHVLWSMNACGSEDWSIRYFNVTKRDIVHGRYDGIRLFEDRSVYDLVSFLSLFGGASISHATCTKIAEAQKKIIYYPFNSIDVLNHAFAIPWHVKLKRPKNLLRGVARQLNIPRFILTRRKTGFGIKTRGWSVKGGVFEPLVSLASKVIEEKQIRQMQSIERKKAMTYWNILNYSLWKRLCVNNEPLDRLLEELHESERRNQ